MGKKYGQNRGNNPPQALPKGRDIHVKEQTTLLAFLLETLKEQSRTAVKSLLSHGQIMINGQSIEKKEVDTSLMIVTKENMYDDESQRLLFSFDK